MREDSIIDYRRVCEFVYVCWKKESGYVCVCGGGINTEIKQEELNGLLEDKMKESDNEDWVET